MNAKGLTLIELVVVVSIIGILLTVATLGFHSMQQKANIEKVTREMLSDLSNVRITAMTKKRRHVITLNPRNYTFKSYSSHEPDAAGVVVLNKNVPTDIMKLGNSLQAFSNDAISVDDRGMTESPPAWAIAVTPSNSDAAVDCLVISTLIINVGKVNGTTCVFR